MNRLEYLQWADAFLKPPMTPRGVQPSTLRRDYRCALVGEKLYLGVDALKNRPLRVHLFCDGTDAAPRGLLERLATITNATGRCPRLGTVPPGARLEATISDGLTERFSWRFEWEGQGDDYTVAPALARRFIEWFRPLWSKRPRTRRNASRRTQGIVTAPGMPAAAIPASPLVGTAREVLLGIARCPLVSDALAAEKHPCADVVRSQRVTRPEELRVPEPWNGHIARAMILFVGSNPTLSTVEEFPRPSWTDDELVGFFDQRFDGHWFREGIYSRRTDGEYEAAQAFCAGIRARAREILGRRPVPGTDYALTEVVHCKSTDEFGVAGARDTCVGRNLAAVLAHSGARVIVALGGNAAEVLRALFGVIVPDRLADVADDRVLLCIPHPNAREKRTLRNVLSPVQLERLRELVLHH